MPVPQRFARGNRMGRGPYEKSGIIEDTGLPPHKTVEKRFEIYYPTEDVTNPKGYVVSKKLLEPELNVKVELWYLPFGKKRTTPFLWREFSKIVSLQVEPK
jgi:hypothetical protein